MLLVRNISFVSRLWAPQSLPECGMHMPETPVTWSFLRGMCRRGIHGPDGASSSNPSWTFCFRRCDSILTLPTRSLGTLR